MALVAAMAGGLVLLLGLTGCHSIGPGSIPGDRSDYSSSVGDSWKRRTLLNIVKLRYLDPPLLLDVGRIVAGYTLQTGVSASGTLSLENAVQGKFVTARSQGVVRFEILEPDFVAVGDTKYARELPGALDEFFVFPDGPVVNGKNQCVMPAAGLTSPAVAGACFDPPSFSTT